MDTLTNYFEFSQDIKDAFQELINDHDLNFLEIHDGCYELQNPKCIFRVTYDRGEVSCNIKKPSSVDNEFGYGVYPVFKYLFPDGDFMLENGPTYNPRLRLFKYAEIIKAHLINILNHYQPTKMNNLPFVV